jgi:hypothetical protein
MNTTPVMDDLQQQWPDGEWIPKEHRLPWVLTLHEEGHSVRAIGHATGVSDTQVYRDLTTFRAARQGDAGEPLLTRVDRQTRVNAKQHRLERVNTLRAQPDFRTDKVFGLDGKVYARYGKGR